MAHILLMARGMNNKLPASLTVVLVALSACGLPDPVAAGAQPSQVASAHPLGGKASTAHVFTVNHDDGNGPPPASADISQYNPPVGDQGQIGDCTTWAFGYAMGGYLAAQAGAPQEFAPMYIFTQLAPSGSTDFGISAQEAFQIMQSGMDTASDYDKNAPTTFTSNGASLPGLGNDAAANDTVDAASAAAKQNAANYTLTSFTTVYAVAPQGTGVCPGYAGGTQPIQTAIANGSPVVVTIPVPPEFDNYDGVHPVVPPTATEVSRGEHLVFCAKYDADGLWCQNSWGTSWGKAGWVQLAWSFVEQCVVETDTAAGMTSIPAPAPTTVAPTTAITSPTNQSTVSGTITITVQATQGTNAIASIALFGNGTQLGSQAWSASGVAWTMDTTQYANGAVAFTAVATDSAGVTGTSSAVTVNISNAAQAGTGTGPSVSITSPANGASLSGTVTVTVQIAPNGAAVVSCTLTANGQLVGQQTADSSEFDTALDTTQIADGPVALTASCTDSASNSGTQTFNLTIAN